MHTGPPIIRAAADGCQLLAAAQLRGSNYAPRNVGKIERAREEEEEATSPTSLVKGKGAGRAHTTIFFPSGDYAVTSSSDSPPNWPECSLR